MKTLRTVLAIATVALLTAGYAISQYALFNGWASDYALRMDSPAVSRLALVLLVVILGLGFVRDPADGEADDS
jgi:hypothetical protein